MALADTARLIASLELQDKFSGPANRAQRQLSGLEGAAGKAGRGFSLMGGVVSTALGVGLERAVGAGIGLISRSVSAGVTSVQNLQVAVAQTNAVLKSTKDVSGQTADGIRQMAERFEDLNATMDDTNIQAGANMLLTFTNIRGKAFEPTLKTLLDMNQALGGGPEGLTKTAIQLGKALNDPIHGLTALRRVGVTFTSEQQKQIETLQKQGKLYEAQQVILHELGTEFGGSFAAAGKTAAGSQAALRDAIEDVQRAMATGLLPGLGRVREGLTKAFRDPGTIAAISSFSKSISDFLTPERIQSGIGAIRDGFRGIVTFAKQVPWQAIGTALQIGGVGAKAILSAFLSAPPWLQTAVITGWGLNKLTGGLAGSLFGNLASGLIKGVLGINAGVVNINAASVTGAGGGAPVAGKTGGLLGGIAKFVLGPAAAVAIGVEIAKVVNDKVIGPTKGQEQSAFEGAIKSTNLDALNASLKAIDDQLNTSDSSAQVALIASRIPFIGDALGNVAPELEKQRALLQAAIAAQQQKIYNQNLAEGARQSSWRARSQSQLAALHVTSLAGNGIAQRTNVAISTLQQVDNRIPTAVTRTAAETHRRLSVLEGTDRATATNTGITARKKFSFTQHLTVVTNTTISALATWSSLKTVRVAQGGTDVRGGALE